MTRSPTTAQPTGSPATATPTTLGPSAPPTTLAPSATPTTSAPTTHPTTTHPTTTHPTTSPTTAAPTTLSPTASPATSSPSASPATLAPSATPTTRAPDYSAAPTVSQTPTTGESQFDSLVEHNLPEGSTGNQTRYRIPLHFPTIWAEIEFFEQVRRFVGQDTMTVDPECQAHIDAGEAALCTGDALVGPYVPIYAENRVDLKVRMLNLATFALLYDEEEGFTEAYQELLVGMTAVMREEFELTVTASALAVVLHAVETDPDYPDTAVIIDFSVVLPSVGTEESDRFRDAFDNNFTHMMGT
ncbi:hypothetical protein CYMTET_8058 [Cymbomonas tetramitiformis]|uniref:Uncharacterized protein n=1 Tax=Cymbomonas tetramitiformis TaxID=36881 RepID=A0AAE0LGV3_9CHLO|nr:hypothetical protein CYMTET_8058 [Cymbomonas tetramitiformis]